MGVCVGVGGEWMARWMARWMRKRDKEISGLSGWENAWIGECLCRRMNNRWTGGWVGEGVKRTTNGRMGGCKYGGKI